jgi:hypothetical protein
MRSNRATAQQANTFLRHVNISDKLVTEGIFIFCHRDALVSFALAASSSQSA